MQRWIETYGRIQATFTETVSTSAYNARKKVTKNVTEIPGIAPTVLPHILHTTAFRSTADLGANLPPLQDEVVYLDMTAAQQADYEQVERFTWNLVREYRNRYLSSWLQWLLARPNSCWRAEQGVPAVAGRCWPRQSEGRVAAQGAWMLQGRRNCRGRKAVHRADGDATSAAVGDGTAHGGITLAARQPRGERRRVGAQPPRHHAPKRVETGLDPVMYRRRCFSSGIRSTRYGRQHGGCGAWGTSWCGSTTRSTPGTMEAARWVDRRR